MASKSGPRHQRVMRLCLVPLGWAAWLFIMLAVMSFHPSDPTMLASSPVYHTQSVPVQNWCGPVGSSIGYLLMNNLGPGTWVALAMAAALLMVWSVGGNLTQTAFRLIGGAVLLVVASGMANLLGWGRNLPAGPGGILGAAIGHFLKLHVSTAGSVLILLVGLIIGLLLAADELVIALLMWIGHTWKKVPHEKIADSAGDAASAAATGLLGLAGSIFKAMFSRKAKNSVRKKPEPRLTLSKSASQLANTVAPSIAKDAEKTKSSQNAESNASTDSIPKAEEPEPAPVVVRRPKPIVADMLLPFKTPPVQKQDLGNYRLPGLDLLEDAEPANTEGQEEAVRQNAKVLESCLTSFNIDGKVVAIDTGPVVTLYELELAPGIKSSQVGALSKDIARALKSPPVRCIDNILGKSTMGIEVPNLDKEKVRLKELMQLAHEDISKMALPMCLGKDASGNPLVEDLAKMPHLLIAGTTGSGKSVCINSIIMTLLLTQRPDHVKMIMVDPKMVEMQDYRQIPHLMAPIIDDMSKAESVLEWATQKMDERYETLSEAGVRHIKQFNQLSREQIIERFQPSNPEEEGRIPFHLPYIVIIIDELADLMMTSKEVEGHIVRIAQKARAVGIHLILATQRPEAQVVTGLIKSNMPGRICFQVRSRLDSRIMLDQSGGELLLGQGDMLMLKPNGGALLRGQGAFVEDAEIRGICAFLKDIAQPEFHPELMQIGAPTGLDEAEKDPLFDEAVKIIIETRRGSVSLLQRRLTIGYSRASRLIDQMRAAGIVGAYKGSQASEVLITMEDWESIKASQPAASPDEPATVPDADMDGDP
ncbi:MAG: DNA translocase FtsK 4TM domain-containing protein [Phycisphaerae bacterium]